jgi:tetratricopeptide (TPR) repeat protein
MNYLKLQTQAYKQMILGQYDESIRDYEICINLQSDDVANFWYLGLTYFCQGNELEAQAIWMTILMPEISEKKKSQIKDLIYILEKELMRQIKVGNLELAKRLEIQIKDIDEKHFIEKLEQAVQATIEKLFKKANQLKKQENYQEAETKYQQILFWNHQHDEAWHHLGLLYLHLFEYGKALDCVMNSINLNPNAGKYHYNVGLILEKLKKIPQSIKAYYKALELDPSLVVAYHQLGNLLSSIGELEEAEKIFRQAK